MVKLILFIFLLTPFLGFTQTTKISGTVVTFNTFQLNNVTIRAKKAKTVTKTDDKGRFELEVKKNDVLRIREPVFRELSYRVSDPEEHIRINLIYDDSESNQVLATKRAYINREDLTYGLQYLLLENSVYGQFDYAYDAIKYAIPIAQITFWNGRRGVMFRGPKTVSGADPLALTIVDGVITDDLNFLSPVNILSIKRLDNQGAALYGARGFNGVIVIETR